MGNEGSKKKSKPIDKSKLDILLKQIFFTAQLNKDRRKGQQNTKEKELLALIREPTNKRNKDNEYSKASAIANDIKSVKAHECIMRYTDILKDNQMVIQLSNGDTSKINDLIPYVESIIWGCQKCNIDCVKQFEEFLFYTFGQETHTQLIQFAKVTPEIKSHFTSILPSEKEVKLFLIDFCNRNGISLETMNEIGHKLSPTELADLPDPSYNSSKPSEPSQSGNQGGSQQGGQGSFPGNFPQGNYPQPGGFSQGNYPPNNFQPQPNYPNYPNYSNPGYGGGYNYPPNNYQPQPNYQGGQPGGYPQQVYGNSQPGYPSQGGPGGSYQPYPSNNGPNYQGSQPSFNPQQQSQPNSNNSYQSPNFPSQNPSGNLGSQGGKAPEVSNKGNDDIGGYPAFNKFTDPPISGGKAGYDPLDELDMRLKNIKNGL